MDTDVKMQQHAVGGWGKCVMGNLLGRGVRKPAELVLQILLIASLSVVTEPENILESHSA